MTRHLNRTTASGAQRHPQETGPRRAARRARVKEKGFAGYLGTALSAVLFLFISATVVLVVIAPLAVGGQPLTVLTNSMAPKLPPGTLIVIKPTPTRDISVGDIVTYQIESGNPAVISHRVVERAVSLEGQTTFVTKGDNNEVVDALPIDEIQVRGTLWYAIPYLGWVNHAINGEARPLVAPIIAVFLIGYAAFTITTVIRGRWKKTRSAPPTAANPPGGTTPLNADRPSLRGPATQYAEPDTMPLAASGMDAGMRTETDKTVGA